MFTHHRDFPGAVQEMVNHNLSLAARLGDAPEYPDSSERGPIAVLYSMAIVHARMLAKEADVGDQASIDDAQRELAYNYVRITGDDNITTGTFEVAPLGDGFVRLSFTYRLPKEHGCYDGKISREHRDIHFSTVVAAFASKPERRVLTKLIEHAVDTYPDNRVPIEAVTRSGAHIRFTLRRHGRCWTQFLGGEHDRPPV